MYIVTNKSQKMFFISISILGRYGVKSIVFHFAEYINIANNDSILVFTLPWKHCIEYWSRMACRDQFCFEFTEAESVDITILCSNIELHNIEEMNYYNSTTEYD